VEREEMTYTPLVIPKYDKQIPVTGASVLELEIFNPNKVSGGKNIRHSAAIKICGSI